MRWCGVPNIFKAIQGFTEAADSKLGAIGLKHWKISIRWENEQGLLQERGFGHLLPVLIKETREINVIPISQQITVVQVKTNDGSLPSHLDNHYCEEEEGNYGPKFMKPYGASHIYNTIPQKEKDLGSFTLPCFINNVCFDNALVDLGTSVSVMPLSTYLNLGLGELVHTKLTVELADRTMKYPKGIAENVLVGIGKFTFLVVYY
ncbi:hypothetical protein Tco_1221445 [Tanacetum coccineum]